MPATSVVTVKLLPTQQDGFSASSHFRERARLRAQTGARNLRDDGLLASYFAEGKVVQGEIGRRMGDETGFRLAGRGLFYREQDTERREGSLFVRVQCGRAVCYSDVELVAGESGRYS